MPVFAPQQAGRDTLDAFGPRTRNPQKAKMKLLKSLIRRDNAADAVKHSILDIMSSNLQRLFAYVVSTLSPKRMEFRLNPAKKTTQNVVASAKARARILLQPTADAVKHSILDIISSNLQRLSGYVL
jgi:hypothetical protein